MKKYRIKSTGEEVNIGDRVSVCKTQRTSFGKLIVKETLYLDERAAKKLIGYGVLEEINTAKAPISDITFYVGILADKLHKSVEEVAEMLEDLNKVCPRAVLDILLNVIATSFYNEDPQAFDEAEHYYSIRLYDGKCGEVHRVHSNIPLFKSKEDVEAARLILKDQLEFMYGEQEGN